MARRIVRYLAGVALLVAAGGGALAQRAAEPAMRHFTLGRLDLIALRDTSDAIPNDGKVFGLGVDPAAVAALLARAGAATDAVPVSIDALLVRGSGRVMLFDTGLGSKGQGLLLPSLAKAGVAPGAVTDVFITHSHGDHVGGLITADGALAFPAAAIHLSQAEWAVMRGRPDQAALVARIAAKVRPFRAGDEVLPGVRSVALAGHTPGHVGYELSSAGATLLDIGDTAHSSIVSLARPDWRIQFDEDGARGVAVRKALLARLAATHQWVFAPHFPFPGIGTIARAGEGYAWTPAPHEQLGRSHD